MGVDDLFHNSKSKAGSLTVFSTGGINLVETVPDFGKTFFWNSGSPVFDRDKNFAMVDGCFQCNGRIVAAEFYCIVQ